MNKPITSVSVLKDAYSTDHQVLFSSYISNKYSLVFENLKIKFSDLELLIKRILEYDKKIIRTDFRVSLFYEFTALESDDFFISFDTHDNKKQVNINYYFHTYQEAKPIFDIIQSFRDDDDELFVSISSFYLDSHKNLNYLENKKIKSDFDYNSKFYYPYLNVEEMFKQFVISDSNIIVLCGEPGVGKSKLGDSFMKYLLENNNTKNKPKKSSHILVDSIIDEHIEFSSKEQDGVKVAYVKNESILSTDNFWNILREDEYDLVFLDDLDYYLLPRTQNVSTSEDIEKNKFISNLLSFTDGIFEAGNKTKFIITTNKEVKDIDTAVLRKGRTFNILELRRLKNHEAKKIWLANGLSEESFISEMGEDSILQAELGSTISLITKAKENNISLDSYILEEGISIYNKAVNPEKIGL